MTVRRNLNNKQKNLGGMLEALQNGEVTPDDVFLRKLRKKIKQAPYSAVDKFDIFKIDNQLMILGTIVTVLGWAMLNACGSGRHNINSVGGRLQSELAYLNTFLSGSFSSVLSFLLKRHIVRKDKLKIQKYDIRALCNGYLAGVAAVSAGCGTMKPWGALATGIIAALLYMTLCLIVQKFKFDDPMENF